jgi:polygalacturonase
VTAVVRRKEQVDETLMRSFFFCLATVFLFQMMPAFGQDTRVVTEPRVPPTCVTLTARISERHGAISIDDEQRLDTDRIQAAIYQCRPGEAVLLRKDGKKDVFLTGPLQLRSSVILVVDAGTILAASRDPRLYDLSPGSCGVVNQRGHGCKPLITGENVQNSGIMGDGVIDGRGGAKLLDQNVSWWDLAHTAKVTDKQQSVPWLIVLHHADGFILYRITLRNSPMFHVAVNQTDGFTAWGVKIYAPATARNTDGIDPGSSSNVTITHCWIHTGDDNVAVKSGQNGPARNISIVHNHFFTGHGMSIGSGTSGGVDHMVVDDLTIDGADNGLRIKSDRSRGGVVRNIVYSNVCMRNVKSPLVFTPAYSNLGGDLLPIYLDITLSNIHIETAGRYVLQGLDEQRPLRVQFDNVFADNQQNSTFASGDAVIMLGPHLGNLIPHASGLTVTQMPDSHAGTPLDCAARYAAFPEITAPNLAESVPPEDHTLYVAADGTGEYSSVQAAIDAAPDAGAEIVIAPGTYREVLTIAKPHIFLRGSGPGPTDTVIVNDRSGGSSGGTLHSATVHVTGDDFTAENITFQNDFNRTHPQLPAGSQALALFVSGDRAIFRDVHVLGNQDTLYAGSRNCTPDGEPCMPARQYFSDCFIAGNVDFIFGDGKAVFDHCEIHSTAHRGGFLTAQAKHYPSEDSGFVFDHCTLTAEPDAQGLIYLGRPWRPYSTVVFLHTLMGKHIDPAGWCEWHPGETHSLETAYYAEYESSGPGAHPGQRDPHAIGLTENQARHFDPAVFLRGADRWNPASRK